MNSHDSALLDIAKFALKRHGSPEKALSGFVDKVWNNAPLLRTVIGSGAIKTAALEYLKSVPSKEGGGVHLIRESRESHGPAKLSGATGSAPPMSATELLAPSSPDPAIVPVVAHNRGKPGNAKRTLKEMAKVAAAAPEFFVALSDGKTNVWTMTFGQIRRLIPNSAYDGALAFLILRHAQVSSDAVLVSETIHKDDITADRETARNFARLVEAGVEVTIGAYVAMEAKRLEAANAA